MDQQDGRGETKVTFSHFFFRACRIVFVLEEICFFVCVKPAVFVSEACCICLIGTFLICKLNALVCE